MDSHPQARGPVTHGRVLKIALPIVISNATVPLLGIVDTGVVGQMGAAAPIGAVGIGAIILSAIYWMFGFLRMGTVGLVAQAQGAGDREEVAALLTRALLIAAAAGTLLIVFQWPIFNASFLVSPASEEVESLARNYIHPHLVSAGRHCNLWDYRLADRAGTHLGGSDPAGLDECAEHGAGCGLCSWAGLGRIPVSYTHLTLPTTSRV